MPIDGSKDTSINIKGLDGYRVRLNCGTSDDLFELDTDSEAEDNEEDAAQE